jgi:peptidoglycan/xylan/chitin deacetylase (PgdA/CDA1 family)
MFSYIKIKIFFSGILILNFFSFAQSASSLKGYGDLVVTTWAYDKSSAFSFSFDDGFISQYENVRDILNQYNFNGTFYLLPPFLADSLPGIWRYGTWPMFEVMSNEGHELASHSLTHDTLTQLTVGDTSTPNTIHYELYHSKRMIDERLQNEDCITFAYPFAVHNSLVDSLTSLYYESARAVDIYPNSSSLSSMEWFALTSYPVEFDEPRISLEDDLDELNDFINWISASIDSGTWAIHQGHEVVPFSELQDLLAQGSYHPISNEWLVLLCEWIESNSNANKIWLETIGNITKYMKERDSYSYQVLAQSNTLIEIELADTLNNEIYNYPLTAYIAVPENWEAALVEQGSGSEILETFYYDSVKVILAGVIPDGGLITITEADPIFVEQDESQLVNSFVLYQNYPNPFNPTTRIKYQIPEESFVTINVYDVLGKEITTLVSEERPTGEYTITFDASALPSGMYVYSFQSGSNYLSKKMILLK